MILNKSFIIEIKLNMEKRAIIIVMDVCPEYKEDYDIRENTYLKIGEIHISCALHIKIHE